MGDEPTSASPAQAGAVTLRLEADVLAALDLWVVDRAHGMSRADAATAALREWLTGHGYLKARGDPAAD